MKKSDDGGFKVKDKSMFLLYIEGNHVSNARSNSMQGNYYNFFSGCKFITYTCVFPDCRTANEQLLEFSERDLAGIKEIQKQENVFALLTCSLCPTIYGQDMVKVR